MKKIYKLFLFASVVISSLTGCSDDEPFITAGPNDTPRFLAPSSIEGNVQTSESMKRDETFTMDVVVTPANYTTIEWLSDGQVLGTGTSFTKQFEAGDYELTILATTQAGKQAFRKVKLSVSALDGDPQIKSKAKNRWLNPGMPFTIEGSNLAGARKLVFTPVVEEAISRAASADGSIEVDCEPAVDGNSITVTLPADMEKGTYRISVVNEQAVRFGCGLVTVSDEEYQEGDLQEVVLWEGNQAIEWNADLCKITAEQMASIPVGTEIKVYYTTPEAEYHAMRITSPQWGETPEDDYVTQFDLTAETPNPFIFVYDERCKALLEERGAICLVGFGYTVQKVACDVQVGENTLWEDSPVTIEWNADLCKLTTEQMSAVPVGATIKVYFELFDAEYHAMRITSPQWGETPEDDFVTQFDLTAETPNPYEFTFDQHCKSLVDERGAMCIVGFGYKVNKITYVK